MAYGIFKNFLRRRASDKVLREKAFNTAKNPKYDSCQKALASMVFTFFDKMSPSLTDKSTFSGAVKSKIVSNQELAEKLHKNEKYTHADLADMQLISKFNKGIRFFFMCYWYFQ